jgi:hypothetical protein
VAAALWVTALGDSLLSWKKKLDHPDHLRRGGKATAAATTPVDDGHGRRVAALTLGGAGAAVLAAGIVFGVVASSSWSNAQRHCDATHGCPDRPDAATERNAALVFGNVSTAGFIAGGALLAGGVVLWLTAPRAGAATASSGPAAELGISPTAGGALRHGTF